MSELIPIIVEFGDAFKRVSDEWSLLNRELPWQIETAVAELLQELGIPGTPLVELRAAPAIDNVRLSVHGVVVGHSLSLMRNIAGLFYGLEVSNLRSSWGKAIAKSSDPHLRDFLTQLTLETIKQRPDTLMSVDQTEAYVRLSEHAIPGRLELPRFTSILRYLLSLRLSIEQRPLIVKHIFDGLAQGLPDTDIAESLVPLLRSNEIKIKMTPKYVSQLFRIELGAGESISVYGNGIDSAVRENFLMMMDALFLEVGIRVPNVVVTASKRIPNGAFSFQINDIDSFAQLGLSVDQLLVNETANALLLRKIEATKVFNPANGNDNAVVHKGAKERLNKTVTTWDPLGYLVLALSQALRHNSASLLHSEVVKHELAQIQRIYPALVRTVFETVPLARLTRTLRELLREQISIRNLKGILERILTCDYVVTDPVKYIVFDDRLAFHSRPREGWRDDGHSVAQHVRAGLKRYISHKFTRGQASLVVLLVDPEIEEMLFDHLAFERGRSKTSALNEEKIALLRDAVREEVSSLPSSASLPTVLTLPEIRYLLRQLIEQEYPSMPVLSYDELSPDMNIQAIARISLS